MALFMSSPIVTGAAVDTRAKDSLTFPFPARPQPMSVYVRIANVHTENGGTYAYLNIGGAVRPYFIIFYQATAYKVQHAGAFVTVTSFTVLSPIQGATVEILGTLTSAGVAQVTVSQNSGALSVGAATSGALLGAAWSTPGTLQLNQQNGTIHNHCAYRDVMVVTGVHTMQEMRRLAGTD